MFSMSYSTGRFTAVVGLGPSPPPPLVQVSNPAPHRPALSHHTGHFLSGWDISVGVFFSLFCHSCQGACPHRRITNERAHTHLDISRIIHSRHTPHPSIPLPYLRNTCLKQNRHTNQPVWTTGTRHTANKTMNNGAILWSGCSESGYFTIGQYRKLRYSPVLLAGGAGSSLTGGIFGSARFGSYDLVMLHRVGL